MPKKNRWIPFDESPHVMQKKNAQWIPQGVAGTPRRFAVGDSVLSNVGTGWWKRGTVVQLDYLEENWPAGRVAPYQIELENGDLIYAPEDSDRLIRAVLSCGNAACGKALAPPLLQCSSCKAEAYCDKACQVGPAAAYDMKSAPHARPLLLAHPFPTPIALAPPLADRRVEGRTQALVLRARAGRSSRADPARRAERRKSAGLVHLARTGRDNRVARPTGDEVV